MRLDQAMDFAVQEGLVVFESQIVISQVMKVNSLNIWNT